jgi:hypothetical protein
MPKTKLTEEQKNEFRKASNCVSLESLSYAADICGYKNTRMKKSMKGWKGYTASA